MDNNVKAHTVKRFINGYKIVMMDSIKDAYAEKQRMGYPNTYDESEEDSYFYQYTVYSLRNFRDKPLAIMTVDRELIDCFAEGGKLPEKKHLRYIQKFINDSGCPTSNAVGLTGMVMVEDKAFLIQDVPEGAHLGEVDLSQYKDLKEWPKGVTADKIILSKKEGETDYPESFYQSIKHIDNVQLLYIDMKNASLLEKTNLENTNSVWLESCKNIDGSQISGTIKKMYIISCDDAHITFNNDIVIEELNISDSDNFNYSALPIVKKLNVHFSDLNGSELLDGIQNLTVSYCDNFDGKNVPETVQEMNIEHCDLFNANKDELTEQWDITSVGDVHTLIRKKMNQGIHHYRSLW